MPTAFLTFLLALEKAKGQIAPNLEAFIGAPKGVALKADHNLYWSGIDMGDIHYVFTKFLVHRTEDDMVLLECSGYGPGRIDWLPLTLFLA